MILLICSLIFVHSSLQYQQIIVSNFGDYEMIQFVSIIYLLIYSIDILSILLFNINQYLHRSIIIMKNIAREYK